MPQSSVKKVSAKEKLMWPKDSYDPHQVGGLVRSLWVWPQRRRLAWSNQALWVIQGKG